jgi:hypothetical protein
VDEKGAVAVTTDEKRKMVEGVTQRLLSAIGKDTLDWLKEHGIGVTLFAFTFEPGAIAYISTSEREDMIRSLKEWIAYQEAGLTTEPRGERGKS